MSQTKAGPELLATDVRAAVARGAETPDYFSTRPVAELQAILHDTPTLGIETLINTGMVRVDFERQHIHRDVFWKGSFAKDSLLGNAAEDIARTFTGGSFWKRFDLLQDGVASGYVVNYEISALPGLPEVRAVAYPDDRRRYFKSGDTVLLLSYTNDPYRFVYDTIKVIDADNALGVMHLGTFPTGMEVATFVLTRHNYPFANMSIPDHQALFEDTHASVPSPDGLAGTRWDGHLIFLQTPDTSLLNQLSPVLFRVGFHLRDGQTAARCRVGAIEFAHALDADAIANGMRKVGSDTLLGRWPAGMLAPEVSAGLAELAHAGPGPLVFYFVLKRSL